MGELVDQIFCLVCVYLVQQVFCHLLCDFGLAQSFDEVVDEIEDLAVARARIFVAKREICTGLNVEMAQGYGCKIESFTSNLLGISPFGGSNIVLKNEFDDLRFLALNPCLCRLNLVPKDEIPAQNLLQKECRPNEIQLMESLWDLDFLSNNFVVGLQVD